ncbi:tetratricopeptide repeat protein [Leptolyngbya subtilissima ST-M1]|uniref:tetratricopeptide repeat protein n=1 Tax=Cyanophyceae TaxID=3028117 RepID=UPI0018EF9FBE|nr:tetratricopeptide repeat protein [Nodosilinea sp. FACHB-131]
MSPADLTPLNSREYRKLLLTLTLNSQQLDLLVAITDDRNLQDQLITAYEADLRDQGIAPLRARLDPKRPSLRATLEKLVAQTPTLQNGEPAVVTVLNAGELLGVRLSDEKSEQEKFFFSLQWTREALRNFGFPIVLWLPDAVATRLAQQAPDFWSWRGGVFEFVAEEQVPERGAALLVPSRDRAMEEPSSKVAIEDLQQQVAQLEQTAPESPLLITLYNNLGEAYAGKYDYKQALELYEKALTLAEAKTDPAGQARSLFNLGNSLRFCGRPFQALSYYQQALSKYQELGDRQGEAYSLGNLGNAYYSLGQYQQAMKYYQQQLAIAQEIGDRQGETNSLGGLGNAYYSLGQYQQAMEYYQQWLAIAREIGDRQGEANSLGGLGNAYYSLGQYQQAMEYYQQWLAIAREIGDRHGEAASLGNLGCAYYSLGQYQQAMEYHQQQLVIAREIGDRQGEAVSLFNLGDALVKLGQKQQAHSNYQAAKTLFNAIGQQHNLEKCDAALRDPET